MEAVLAARHTPTVHLIHGINTADPLENVGLLREPLEHAGFSTVCVHNHGFYRWFTARFRNRALAKKVLPHIEPGDIVIGHSNGATIIAMLADMGAPISGAVLINPALDKDHALASQAQWVHVYYNSGDDVVSWSRLLLGHRWGEQGRVGFTGKDPRYKQFRGKHIDTHLDGHSDIFTPQKLPIWGPFLAQQTWCAYGEHRD